MDKLKRFFTAPTRIDISIGVQVFPFWKFRYFNAGDGFYLVLGPLYIDFGY